VARTSTNGYRRPRKIPKPKELKAAAVLLQSSLGLRGAAVLLIREAERLQLANEKW
jgi:hypothetical protein